MMRVLVYTVVILLLAACGLKGPLYLPEQKPGEPAPVPPPQPVTPPGTTAPAPPVVPPASTPGPPLEEPGGPTPAPPPAPPPVSIHLLSVPS